MCSLSLVLARGPFAPVPDYALVETLRSEEGTKGGLPADLSQGSLRVRGEAKRTARATERPRAERSSAQTNPLRRDGSKNASLRGSKCGSEDYPPRRRRRPSSFHVKAVVVVDSAFSCLRRQKFACLAQICLLLLADQRRPL